MPKTQTDHAEVYAVQLRRTADRLTRWADEAERFWSTQHVEAMRLEAARIYALLGRLDR